MARQARSKAPSSVAAATATMAATASSDNTASAGYSASLTPDELAALLDAPIRTLLGTLDRLAEKDDGEALLALERWLGLVDEGEGADDELIEAKRTVEDIFATTAFESALFIPLPPLSATPAAQLAPLQQANLARLVLSLAELAHATSTTTASLDGSGSSGNLSQEQVELIWQMREGAWREAFSLVGAEAVAVDEDGEMGGDDPLRERVGRIIASGQKEKERREALLQRRASALLELCSFTQTILAQHSDTADPQVEERLSDVYLPTFMGSADQVALPGRERRAVFRSAREKEGLLKFWADEVDLKLEELQKTDTDELRQRYSAHVVLERLLTYAVHDIWLPYAAQQSSRAGQHTFLDSQLPGERMLDSLDDDLLPPSHQPAGSEDFIDSQPSIEDTLDSARVEADLPQDAPAATKKGKGKGRKAVARREVVVEESQVPELAPEEVGELEDIIDPTLEPEASGRQSLDFAGVGQDDEAAAAAAVAAAVAAQASYVDSQESLISSLGAENLWNDFRLQGLPVNEYVQNLAQESQTQYSQEEQSMGGQPIEPSQDDSEVGLQDHTGHDMSGVGVEDGTGQHHDQLDDGSLPTSVLDAHEPPLAAQPSARARGKKRAREPSTSSIVHSHEVDDLGTHVGHDGNDDGMHGHAIDHSAAEGSSLGQQQQQQLESPVKARKENTGRGNSGKSAKGYLYFQGRNETGRKPWRPEEDACLRQAMEQFEGQKMLWSKIIGEHGPKGTVDTILADRTSVSCKDRARNLKTIMLREHTEAPAAFSNITLPKRQRLNYPDGRQPSAGPSQQGEPSGVAPAPELEEAALSLQSLTSQHHHQHLQHQPSQQLDSEEVDQQHWNEQPPHEIEAHEVDPGLMEHVDAA